MSFRSVIPAVADVPRALERGARVIVSPAAWRRRGWE